MKDETIGYMIATFLFLVVLYRANYFDIYIAQSVLDIVWFITSTFAIVFLLAIIVSFLLSLTDNQVKKINE